MRTGRLEALSDGVLARITTITVLELQVPDRRVERHLGTRGPA